MKNNAVYLKKKRKELGMTPGKFAELLGVPKNIYQQYEKGDKNVSDNKFYDMKRIIESYEKIVYGKCPIDIGKFLEISRNEFLKNISCRGQIDIVNAVFDFLIRRLEW